MADKFYFFTDIDLLSTQSSGDEFGFNTQTDGNDIFQLSSIHHATSNPNAYAVCKGNLFIQDVANSGGNLVNIVLQPTQQPPFAFPKVKFFVYRGILKSSLISGNDVASSGTNDLTKSLWDSQTSKNTSAETNDNAPKEALGIDLSSSVTGFSDGDPIDNAFYRTGVNYQLPFVKSGWKIGTFDQSGFGFEIMLESVGFNPSLELIRNVANNNNVNNVTVATLPVSPTQSQFFEHWHDKEEILNYVDPCAFFGSFYYNKLAVKKSTNNTTRKKGNAVYDDVLDGKFLNKNKVYIDIRNEYNFSINYFKNYGASLTDVQTNISIYDANNPYSSRDYYTGNWPLLILTLADFNASNTSSKKNTINVSLPNGNGENALPTVFLSSGTLATDFPRETKGKNKLTDLTVTNNFTDEMAVAIPNRDGLPNTTPISIYIRLKYLKRLNVNPPSSSDTVIRAQNYLDNLFAPFDMRIPYSGNANIKSAVYDEEMFVDASQYIGADFIAKVGVSEDINNFVFFCYPEILRESDINTKVLFSFSSEIDNVLIDSFDFFASKAKNKEVVKRSFDLTESVNSIQLEDVDKGLKQEFNIPNMRQFIASGVSKTEFNSIKISEFNSVDISSFEQKYRIYLLYKNRQSGYDNNGQAYTTYDLYLTGFALISGFLKVNVISTNIKIYFYGSR